MRVLVVEDDARLAAQLGEALREAGYAVDLLSDGQAAWVHGGVEPVDAVVLDLGLPRLAFDDRSTPCSSSSSPPS